MNLERLDEYINGWLEDRLTDRQQGELEAWLLDSPPARQRFWELASMHGLTRVVAKLKWQDRGAGAYPLVSADEGAEVGATAATTGDEPAEAEAQTHSASAAESEAGDAEWFIKEIPLPPPSTAAALPPTLPNQFGSASGGGLYPVYWRAASVLLAVLLTGSMAGWWLWPRPPAQLTAVAGAHWRQPAEVTLGTEFDGQRSFELTGGVAEVTFRSGARVLIEGPAVFQPINSRSIRLMGGKLTALVPPRASGFAVLADDLWITDLGTEFGVQLDTDGKTELLVMQGKVEIDPPGSAPPQLLVVDQAVQYEPNSRRIEPVPVDRVAYVRDVSRARVPLLFRSTGLGLRPGDDDRSWRIVASTFDRQWQPRFATVTAVEGNYLANDPARSQWLSTAGDFPHVPGDETYTFETSFDLTEFDPLSARLRLRVAADDQLVEVRLNGKRCPIPHIGFHELSDVAIEQGFRAGRNVLEFVVRNQPDLNGRANRMVLRVEAEGTGILKSERYQPELNE